MKQWLILLFLVISMQAQPLHPLQPSFLSGSLSAGYTKTTHISKGFHLNLNSSLGAHFSPFPPKWGAAPFFEARSEARYCFGKEYPKGFGIGAFASTELMLNPIFYKGERYDIDPLWSVTPGASLFWTFEPKGIFTLEPYASGQCRFFTSLTYDTGVIPFLCLDFGVRFSVNRKQIQK